MKNPTIYLLLLTIIIVTSGVSDAQTVTKSDADTNLMIVPKAIEKPDTTHKSLVKRIISYFQQANVDKTFDKKIDFSIIGGPHYSSSVGFGLGVVAAGLYRIDRTDHSIPPSNISFFGDVTTTGVFMLGIRGNNFIKGAKYRIDYTTFFQYHPGDFWGVGYDAGAYNDKGSFKQIEVRIDINGMIRVMKNSYIGVSVSFDYINGNDFTNPEYIPPGQNQEYLNTGLGFFLLYDSRDAITSPYRGWYFKLDQKFFPNFMGNNPDFNRTELVLDFYHHAWKGATLAYDLHAQLNYGDVPWTMIAQLGGPYRMRGYYQGRYRDNNIVEIQAELRQKVYRRNGVAVWVGAGNIFPTFSEFNTAQTLPNYGIGYRWEFKKRVNVRLDYGFGKNLNGFIFNINEAF